MFRYREGDVCSLLSAAYAVVRGDVSAPSMVPSISGGRSSASKLESQLELAAASRVVSLIDKELPPWASAYFRFMFGEESSADYDLLSKYLNVCVSKRGEGIDDFLQLGFSLNVGRLTTLAPYQYQYRLTGNSKMRMTQDALASFVGCKKTNFKDRYQAHWEFMFDKMDLICHSYESWIISFVEG